VQSRHRKRKLIYNSQKAMDAKARNYALERIPLKRFGKPEEIAEAALFLVRNEYANNCIINLDGGLSAAVSHGNLLKSS
jgi:NAD(P)-dependent dehydrogenase (short-subunit alcohol dehydrogenase family)